MLCSNTNICLLLSYIFAYNKEAASILFLVCVIVYIYVWPFDIHTLSNMNLLPIETIWYPFYLKTTEVVFVGMQNVILGWKNILVIVDMQIWNLLKNVFRHKMKLICKNCFLNKSSCCGFISRNLLLEVNHHFIDFWWKRNKWWLISCNMVKIAIINGWDIVVVP